MGKGKIEKSDVIIECTPDTEAEVSWETVIESIKATELSGVTWAPDMVLQDFVFGMKKLVVVCQIVNNMVPTTTVIVEALQKIAGVGGAEMTSIETAANDWAKEDKKKEAKKGGENKGQSKKKKKKGKKEVVRVIDDAMIAKAAQKIIILTKEADFYVTGCPEVDGSGQTNPTKEQMQKLVALVREKNTTCGVMLVSAGANEVSVIVDLPEDKVGTVKASEWLASVIEGGEGDDKQAFAVKVCDAEKGEFSIKVKDDFSASAFGHLKKVGALVEESDDECYTFDDEEEEW